MTGSRVLPVFVLAAAVAAGPLSAGGRLAGNSLKLPINRRSMRQGPPVTDDTGTIFDPSYPEIELRGITSKYEQAAEFLQGVGLNPDKAIEIGDNYHPLGNNSMQSFDISSMVDYTVNQASYQATDAPDSGSKATTPDDGNEKTAPDHPSGAFLPSVGDVGRHALKDYVAGTMDLMYYGPIQIGTPAQTLSVDVDTGSADLWFPVDCDACTGRQFQSTRSSTYRPSGSAFSVTYGSGRVSGVLANDVVTIADLTVSSQTFGAVSSESSEFRESPNDGLIGMAFGTIAHCRQPTFFENLIQQRIINAPMFGIHLERGRSQGSEVCLGCYDSSFTTAPIIWVPVKSRTYWSVGMEGVRANGVMVHARIYAAIDTGTTLIYLPPSLTEQLYRALGGRPADRYGQGFYTYPCALRPKIELVLGGHAFAIDERDFNLGRTAHGSSECVGGILALGRGFPDNLAIVGDEFLKSWYSVYDYSSGARVGFAPDVNNHES